MKREQALRIAKVLVAQTSDIEITNIGVKSMEPAGGRITVAIEAVGKEEESDRYEVEIEPITNAATLKKIKGTYSLGDYLNEPTFLSQLTSGQLFKLKYDCVVYEYYRTVQDRSGRTVFTFSRQGHHNLSTLTHDVEVFPIA